jgi:hypothetical protein
MSDYGDKPFGINDIKITNMAGDDQVDLPAARTLSFSEIIQSSELSGDDQLKALVSRSQGVEWSLEAGGISLEAYALLTGRTETESGSTPNRTLTLTGDGGDCFPYVKIYGKAIGDDCDSDVHLKLFKAKVENIEGSFQDGQFFVTSCSGRAIDDGSNGTFEFVQNETATDLPAT